MTFEDKLWEATDKLRKKVEVHEYKYIVLGLIFLRYLSFAFEEKRKEIEEKEAKHFPEDLRFSICEDRDFYLANGPLYVPEKARWDYIKKNANQPNIGEIIDQTMEILENEYPKQLKDVIPKIYSHVNLDSHDFAYLINLFSQVHFGKDHQAKDIFGRIYEYFLGKFTEAEDKKGGEFYTPRSLTKLIVEILDVKEGRIFDTACGSGEFFISALEKLQREGIEKEHLSIYGRGCPKNIIRPFTPSLPLSILFNTITKNQSVCGIIIQIFQRIAHAIAIFLAKSSLINVKPEPTFNFIEPNTPSILYLSQFSKDSILNKFLIFILQVCFIAIAGLHPNFNWSTSHPRITALPSPSTATKLTNLT